VTTAVTEQKEALTWSLATHDLLRIADQERLYFDHSYLGTEHLLLALMQQKDTEAARVFASLNLDLEQTRQEVLKVLDPNYEASGDGTSPSRAEKG